MDNFLKGIQYREQTAAFTAWHQAPLYGPWADIARPDQIFHTGTQFRPRPKFTYSVTIGLARESNLTLDAAMAKVAKAAKEGLNASLTSGEVVSTVSIKGRKLQYRLLGDSVWQNLDTLLSGTRFSHPVKFRVRPDYYFTLDAHQYDSEEELKAAITLMIDNGQYDFTVKKVMYE